MATAPIQKNFGENEREAFTACGLPPQPREQGGSRSGQPFWQLLRELVHAADKTAEVIFGALRVFPQLGHGFPPAFDISVSSADTRCTSFT